MTYHLTEEQIESVLHNSSLHLVSYCQLYNKHDLVVPVSGGIDSALVLGFAQKACQRAAKLNYDLKPIALLLPCETHPEDTDKGIMVAKKFGANIRKIDLDDVYNLMVTEVMLVNDQLSTLLKERGKQVLPKEWSRSTKIAFGNIKARLRMIFTYHVARMLNGLVLGTGNLSEYWMGFWTLGGDVGDYYPILHVLKGSEVYDIARYISVPERILDAQPADGLGITASDADSLGADYPDIDKIMITLLQRGFELDGSITQLEMLSKIDGIDPVVVKKIARQALVTDYKRSGPVILTRKQLGLSSIEGVR